MDELGNEISFKQLDQLDVLGCTHVGQYLHRLGQVAQILKTYGHLSEDALLGFARAYRFLSVRGNFPQIPNVVRDRAYDLLGSMNARYSNNGAKKLAETLEGFATLTSEGVGPWSRFIVPKIHELYPTLYRIANSASDPVFDNGVQTGKTLLEFVKEKRRLPKSSINPDTSVQLKAFEGHYVTPHNYGSPSQARSSLQIDTQWSPCDMKLTINSHSVDTNGHQCVIPNSASRKTDTLQRAHEPCARDHHLDEGNENAPLAGGGSQFLVEGGEVTKIEVWNGSEWIEVPFDP